MSRDWNGLLLRYGKCAVCLLLALVIVWKGNISGGMLVDGFVPGVLYSVLATCLVFTGVAYVLRADELSMFHDTSDEPTQG